jgi:hypothetical protein
VPVWVSVHRTGGRCERFLQETRSVMYEGFYADRGEVTEIAREAVCIARWQLNCWSKMNTIWIEMESDVNLDDSGCTPLFRLLIMRGDVWLSMIECGIHQAWML